MRRIKSLVWIFQVLVVFLAFLGLGYWLIELDTRVRIYKPMGWISLGVVSFLVLCGIYYEIKERCSRHPPAIYSCFYIYERSLDTDIPSIPREDLTLRVVTRLGELAGLTDDRVIIARYERLLNGGGIVFCALVGTELAHTSGVALSKEAHKKRTPWSTFIPYGYATFMWEHYTVEKYRRRGIYFYVQSKMYRYLRARGVSRVVCVVGKKNIPARNAQVKSGSQILGMVHMVTRFFRVFRLDKSHSALKGSPIRGREE